MSVIKDPRLRWIFIGSCYDAKNIEWLKSNRVRYILNCTDHVRNGGVPNYHQSDPSFEYCRLPLSDNDSELLSHHYQKCWEFFDRSIIREDGCLLVHCKLGISRSAACLMSFLIKFMKMSYAEALQLLTVSRPHVDPNSDFRQQLQQLSKQLEGKKEDYWQFQFKDENESLLFSGRCFEAWKLMATNRKLGPTKPVETSRMIGPLLPSTLRRPREETSEFMIADIVSNNAAGVSFVIKQKRRKHTDHHRSEKNPANSALSCPLSLSESPAATDQTTTGFCSLPPSPIVHSDIES